MRSNPVRARVADTDELGSKVTWGRAQPEKSSRRCVSMSQHQHQHQHQLTHNGDLLLDDRGGDGLQERPGVVQPGGERGV